MEALILLFKRLWKGIRRIFGFREKDSEVLLEKVAIVGSRDATVGSRERVIAGGGEIAKPEKRRFRFLRGRRRGSGPDMPRYQPCPLCRHGSKRGAKTVGGAQYYCPDPDHGVFLVKAK